MRKESLKMDELKKYWNKHHIWILLILKSLTCFIYLGLFCIVGNLINNYILGTLIYAFSLVGVVYSFVSLFIFILSNVHKCKEKDKLSWFTIIYMLIFIFIAICFRNSFHLTNYSDIIDTIKKREILNLFSLMTADFMIAGFFLLFYFYRCFIVVKRFRILFIEKSLRSVLVAVTAWLLVATNINIISIEGNYVSKLFVLFYIIISSITTLLYPFFDMFEFTYKQLNEIEKEQVKETESKKREEKKESESKTI